MKDVHLGGIDLNLLRVFDALYEERSVTRAGDRLALTQSAVSHALGRLRAVLDDELFVRGPGGMRPTPRAAQLWPEIRRGLDQFRRALAAPGFDPAQSERRFRIAAPPVVVAVLLPGAIRRFRAEAPGAELRIQRVRGETVTAVESGEVDLALGAFGRVPEELARETLLEERLVWVMRAAHPAAAEALTLERLSELSLLMISVPAEGGGHSGGERRVLIDDGGAWEKAVGPAARRRISVAVDDVQAALAIVAQNDLAALLPQRVAQAWANRLDLRLFEPPYPSPPMAVQMLWREAAPPDAGVVWLLDLIRRSAAEAPT